MNRFGTSSTHAMDYLIALPLSILAYEWLISGVGRMMSGSFAIELHRQMENTIPDMKHSIYVTVLGWGLAHSVFLATAIEVGEFVVGVAFAVLAVQAWRHRFPTVALFLGLLCGLASTFVSVNLICLRDVVLLVDASEPNTSFRLLMVLMEAGISFVYAWMLSRQYQQRIVGGWFRTRVNQGV